jgi:hypothetical protein
MDSYFAGRLGVAKRIAVPALDELRLSDAAELLERVGALHAGGYSRFWRKSKNVNLSEEENRAAAFGIITQDRLQSVLEATYKGFLQSGEKKAPALTSAYGWFYYWYCLKGGSSFSLFLTEQIAQHAKGKFHIAGKVGRGKAPYIAGQQHNRGLNETARECGVKTRELRKIAELYGLIVPNTSACMILIDRTDAEALVTIHKRLLKKKEAGAILGFRAKPSIDSFVKRGLLTPFINGPATMPLTYKFLEDDVADLVSAVKRRCSLKKPNVATRALGGPMAQISVGDICAALLSGEIGRAWINPKGGLGLRSIMIAKADLRVLLSEAHRAKRRAYTTNTGLRPFSYWRERAKELKSEPAHRPRSARPTGFAQPIGRRQEVGPIPTRKAKAS